MPSPNRNLDQVKRIVKVNGYIACDPSFTALPAVLNGCSNLLGEVFEERGVHARAAVGVVSLPLGVPIEIDLVAQYGVTTWPRSEPSQTPPSHSVPPSPPPPNYNTFADG